MIGFFFLYFVSHTNAEVRINEIYPAPKSGSGETEWIELYNDEDTVIDLSSYTLNDEKETPIKILQTNIAPYEFIIVETSSVLNNSGDTIYLKNNSMDIEQVAYAAFDEKKSFIRCPDGNGTWVTSTTQTKQVSNQNVCLLLIPTPTITPTITPLIETVQPTVTPTPTTIPISHNNIFISEVMPYPEDNNSEWIEIYNNNDFSVSLDNWYIDDGENTGSSPKLFTINIASKQYIVIDVSLFNNDGDIVRLLDFNKAEKDSFSYTNAAKGKTYGRTSFPSNNFCEQDPTKGTFNNACRQTISLTPAPSLTPTSSPTHTIAPTQPPPSPTAFFTFAQAPIIVDSHISNNTDIITTDTPVLPSQGSVLSAQTQHDNTNLKSYAFGLSSSSALISLVNIGNIIRKIIQRLKFNL